jgi:hypothetical protein
MLLGKVVICLQKTETGSIPISLYKNQLKVDVLNIRPKILQIIKERTGNTLEAISIGKDFFSRTQAAQQLRQRMDKQNYMKFKSI